MGKNGPMPLEDLNVPTAMIHDNIIALSVARHRHVDARLHEDGVPMHLRPRAGGRPDGTGQLEEVRAVDPTAH